MALCRGNVGGMVLSLSMESMQSVTATADAGDAVPHADFVPHADVVPVADVDALERDFDREFDAMVSAWIEGAGVIGADDETQECLDALVETRAVVSAMHAREQRLLARLEAIALASPKLEEDPRSREISWRSMAAEIAVATHQADRTVQSMLGNAVKFVEKLPLTLAALERGDISIAHARVILENSALLTSDDLPEYERATVAAAEQTTPGKLASRARVLATRLSAHSFEERHERARDERAVMIRDLDNGMSELLHVLPTPFAAAIFDRLTRQAKAVAATGDPRTRDQLRSDLATDLLLTGEPSCADGAPHTSAEGISAQISITIPALTLLGIGSEPATMTGRGPIDLTTAQRLAAAAPEFTRVLVHPISDMVVAADTYRPSTSLRRFLAARDKHCQFPMCNRDARWCDIDHTVAWEEGGKSVPENLAHLCRGHHTLKHHAGWSVKQVSPGVLEWRTPRGDIVTGVIPPPLLAGPRFEYQDSAPPF